jgi:hypothetical protein
MSDAFDVIPYDVCILYLFISFGPATDIVESSIRSFQAFVDGQEILCASRPFCELLLTWLSPLRTSKVTGRNWDQVHSEMCIKVRDARH